MLRSLVENLHSPHDEKVLQLLAICDAGTVEEILAKADADAAAALRVAAEEADARHRWQVSPLHLLRGIFSHRNERVSKLLAEVGTNESKLQERARSWL